LYRVSIKGIIVFKKHVKFENSFVTIVFKWWCNIAYCLQYTLLSFESHFAMVCVFYKLITLKLETLINLFKIQVSASNCQLQVAVKIFMHNNPCYILQSLQRTGLIVLKFIAQKMPVIKSCLINKFNILQLTRLPGKGDVEFEWLLGICFYSFIWQGIWTRWQRSELFGPRVKLLPVQQLKGRGPVKCLAQGHDKRIWLLVPYTIPLMLNVKKRSLTSL